MMHSNHFLAQTGIKFSSSLISKRSSDELIAIHRDLNAFERGDYPKFKPEARWDFMLKLAGKCELYMKDKEGKGRDLSKPKHLCVQQLSAELTREVAAERNKAQKYGDRVAAARGHTSTFAFGESAAFTHVATVKGKTYDLSDLYRFAETEGIRISGNDNVDAFVLREWLKQMARQNRLEKVCVTPVEILNREQRRKRRLSFRDGKCFQDGKPFNSFGNAPFLISGSGEWYALPEPSANILQLLSVGEVLYAGEMRVENGTLQWIMNASTDPKINDFLTVVAQLRRSGLDQAARHKIAFLVHDGEVRYAPWPRTYLFPYSLFAQANGNVLDPSAYEVRGSGGGGFFWQNPGARRHGCHHLRTYKGDAGHLVVFPK